MPKKPLIQICLVGDLSIDYRVHKTALSLIDMGFDVICIARSKAGYGKPKDQLYHSKILKTIFKNGALFYAEFNVRLFVYLLIHGSSTVLSIDLDTLAGCWLATRFRRRKLVFDSHEYFPEVPELQHRPMIKSVWIGLEKFLVPKVDGAYTVCDSIAQLYNKKYHKHFAVVRNLPLSQRLEFKEKAIIDPRFKLVYQGAVNLGRGIFETLEAIKLVDDVVFIIIGDGDDMGSVKQFVDEHQLNSKVMILGKIPFDKLAAYTQSADVGMCLLENIGLNYYYSLPNRIFDFALAGVPVLASNFPEIARVVNGYKTGLLVDDLKPQTIADAINELKNNKTLYQSMADTSISASSQLVWEKEEHLLANIFKR